MSPAPVLLFFILLLSHLSSAQELKITLEDSFQMALINNEKIQQARLDAQIAQVEADSSNFDFDYQTTLSFPYKKQISLSNYSYEDAVVTERSYGISGGLKTKTRFGTELAAVIQSLRINTTSTQSSLPDRSQVAASIKLTQPLLKGAGRDVNEVLERRTKASLEKYKFKLHETTQSQLLKIGGLFWDLYEATQEYTIAKAARQRAKEIYNAEKTRFEFGQKSNLDFLRAKANHALAEAKAILAQSSLLEAEEKLAREILPLSEKQLDFSLVPVASPTELSVLLTRESALLKQSFVAHPKLSRMAQEVSEAEIDLKKSDHNRLPQLDLSVEYISTGVNALTRSALSQVSKLHTPSLEIVLSLTFPLGGYASTGDYIEKKISHTSKDLLLEKEKQFMKSNLFISRQTLQNNIEALQSLRSRVSLEKQKIEAKESLFKAGRLNWQEYLDGINDYQNLLKMECNQFVTLQKSFLKAEEVMGQIGNGHPG